MTLAQLQPRELWSYFFEICKIPRPSKKEEKIVAYLMEFARVHSLEAVTDKIGNVIISKPATKGMENRKTVVLQSHVDMVGEKNNDTQHDFEKDPIIPYIDGDWVKAKGTTLGADDGIGIAAQLAILAANDIPHGPIECLFTIDEETGLTGAFGLDKNVLDGRILLNLDSEDEGEIFIGCAGGKDTLITFEFDEVKVPANHEAFRVEVKGLKGGHSGDDINKGLGNANKLLTRILWKAARDMGISIASIKGGNLRNAIAREAEAVVLVHKEKTNDFVDFVNQVEGIIRAEFAVTEPDISITASAAEMPEKVMGENAQQRLLNALYATPHGVMAMSATISNFVETSTNLASVKLTEKGKLTISTSQRSSVESAKDDIGNMVVAVWQQAGATAEHSDGYPGWTPNPDSEILELARNSYEGLFGKYPKVLAIHAGLECGVIGEKYPGMDMISYGPTIKGAHSPDERLLIDSVQKFWDLTLDILRRIPEAKG